MTTNIPGYTYGSADLKKSPVSMDAAAQLAIRANIPLSDKIPALFPNSRFYWNRIVLDRPQIYSGEHAREADN